MEFDSANPQETAAAEVADRLLGMSLPALSSELREFLSTVVGLYSDTDKAMDWLQANNNALQGQSPVDMIRAGKIQELNDFWNTNKRVHGY